MTSYFPLPVALEEITAEWLTAAIRQRAPEATVLAFEPINFMRTTATKVRLRLTLDEAAKRAGIPDLVILKGGFEAHSQKVGMPEMHLKEVQAYRDVFPALKLPTPACYFADYDPEHKQGIVIMEDLVARGVTFCHALRPQNFEEASRRLRALAAFHAKTWDSVDLKPDGRFGELHEFLGNLEGFVNYHLEPETWERFNGSAQRACVSQTLLSRDWMAEAFPKMVTFARSLPQCVIHGDMHLNNLYIDIDGTPGFYDSLATTGPGMLEVAYHIAAGIDLAHRARWEGALVAIYLDELSRNGVTVIPFDEAYYQYKVLLLYGHFVWITNESHYQSDAINTANAARAGMAMLDHQVMALIDGLPG